MERGGKKKKGKRVVFFSDRKGEGRVKGEEGVIVIGFITLSIREEKGERRKGKPAHQKKKKKENSRGNWGSVWLPGLLGGKGKGEGRDSHPPWGVERVAFERET